MNMAEMSALAHPTKPRWRRGEAMNGICRILDCHYGAQFDPSDDTWSAIKVYRDGNPIILDGGFASEEEAEACADLEHESDLQANGRNGVGA